MPRVNGNSPGPLELSFALIKHDPAHVDLGEGVKRGQVKMVVRILVRMKQVGAVENGDTGGCLGLAGSAGAMGRQAEEEQGCGEENPDGNDFEVGHAAVC